MGRSPRENEVIVSKKRYLVQDTVVRYYISGTF